MAFLSYFRNPVWLLFGASLLLNVILWVLAATTFPKDTSATILHYTSGVGIDFIGESRQIYILPAIGLFLLSGNTVLAHLVKRSSPRAAWVLWLGTPAVEIILLVSYAVLLILNT